MSRRHLLAIVVATVVVLALFATHTSATGSASSLLFSDPQERVKVIFISDPRDAAPDFFTGDRATQLVPMALANGSKYQCRLPGRSEDSNGDDERMWRRHLQKVRDHPLPPHQLNRLNIALSEQCFTQPAGWWTYKLCWGRTLTQFHADATGRVEAEYTLGIGPLKHVEDGAVDELLYDVDPFSPTRARLVAEWFNGTECDLTKEQRMMQLIMYCPDATSGSAKLEAGRGGATHKQPNDGGYELSVVEPRSCVYQVTLKHPAFCNIAELRARTQPEVLVQCLEIPAGATEDDMAIVVAGTNSHRKDSASASSSSDPSDAADVQVVDDV